MRQDYRGVTPETKAALEDFVKQIAAEWDVEPQYLYAILSGKEPDPFKKFKRMFRATARKNPNGARGFIASLSAILREEEPRQSEPVNVGDAAQAFGDFVAVAVEREEGHCSAEKLEAAKARVMDAVDKVTVYKPVFHMRNAG